MNKLISNCFSIDYSIFMHDSGNLGMLEFYFYEKDLINDTILAMQYYGKSINGLNKNKYNQSQDMFIFDEKNLYNFVNKLDEFLNSDD